MIAGPRMVGPHKLPVRQRSPEWLEARRTHITATDIPVLLGLSSWKCEQDLADEKLDGKITESTLRMRVGAALEDLIAAAYAEQTGRKVRRVHGLWESATIPWAAASPDATAAGRLIELKYGAKSRFAAGLPEDIEAQVQWQAFVAEVPEVDVAILEWGADQIDIKTIEADPATQENFVKIAADFRRRLDAGGPFAQSAESVRRKYPQDDGTILEGTRKWRDLAVRLGAVRAAAKLAAADRDSLEFAIREMLAEASGVKGDGWEMTLRRNKPSTRTNWPAVAVGYRELLEEVLHSLAMGTAEWPAFSQAALERLDPILSIHTETVPGPRVLRTSFKGETDD